jgi:folate-binding protein YgfZ
MADADDDTGGLRLSGRGLVAVTGPETRKFLQGLLTADTARLEREPAMPAALLTPQGKVLVEMIVIRREDGVIIECAAGETGALLKRLALYRLRARIELADRSADLAIIWSPGDTLPDGFADPRLPDLGSRAVRALSATDAPSDAAYHGRRIALGVAEQGSDYGAGEVFPYEANLDQLGGVDFDKGCYVGQEVVSRMHHRGTARSRFVPVTAAAELPELGTPVTAGGKILGRLGSHQGRLGLALLRLDRLAESVLEGRPTEAAGIELRVVRPAWARFEMADAAGDV